MTHDAEFCCQLTIVL